MAHKNFKPFRRSGMPVPVLAFFFLLTFGSVPFQLEAEESNPGALLKKLSLEQLMEIEVTMVYGASQFEQKITEAPSSVTVVTAEEIKKYGYRTLAEILKGIRGVFITNDRNYSYLGVRGFGRPGDYNSRILLLIDGHRVNDNIYDSLLLGTEFILDIDLIDRLEFIRGPGSSLYGSNAFFAVIQIFTKKGRGFKGAEASAEAGSLDTYKGRLSYGNRFKNDLEMVLSGSYYDSKGNNRLFFKEFDSPSTNNGFAENCDGDRANNFFSTLSKQDWTLQGAYNDRKKILPAGSFGTDFNNPANHTDDRWGYLDLKYQHGFENGLDLTARLYYDQYQYNGDYIYSGRVNKDYSLGEWWGMESRATRIWFEKHKVTLGVEYIDNVRQDQGNYDLAPYVIHLDDKRSSRSYALYAQDAFSILKNLIFNAGVRFDYFDTFGGTTNPRLALIYSPLEQTTLKLLYGSAFRKPNDYELYYNDQGETAKSNPNLRPETIKTYELVWEQYMGKNLRGSSSFFYYLIDDLINQTVDPADGLLVYQNSGKTEAQGLELELEGRWATTGIEGKISYAFLEAKNKDTGETLTNSPKHLAKLKVSFPILTKKIFFSPELQYMSKRKTLAGNDTEEALILNATLFARKLLPGLEISGSVYNLFDKTYGDPVGAEFRQDAIFQDGRTFRLKLTCRF